MHRCYTAGAPALLARQGHHHTVYRSLARRSSRLASLCAMKPILLCSGICSISFSCRPTFVCTHRGARSGV